MAEDSVLTRLCTRLARRHGARRVAWIADDGERLYAGPGRISPRELEAGWIDERRRAGPGIRVLRTGELARRPRALGLAELWLVRSAAGDTAAGVLLLELERPSPEPDPRELLEAAGLADALAELDAARRGARADRLHVARGRHVARLVHDLRQRITLARMLAADASDTARAELTAALEQCSALCGQALGDPERIARPERVDLARLARAAARDALRCQVPPGRADIRVTDEGDEPLTVVADPSALARVALNLLTNALEASPAGGVVQVAARRRAARVELVVTDRGRGLSDDERRRLLDGRRPPRGDHGHGFASVQAQLAALGAELELESRVGEGTCVRVLLPAELGRETLLLVDPLPERRRALAGALERAGWRSRECADPRAARAALPAAPRAVALARGAAPGLGALVAAAHDAGVPCFVLPSAAEALDPRERAGTVTARLALSRAT